MCLKTTVEIESNVPIIGFKHLIKQGNKFISPITKRTLIFDVSYSSPFGNLSLLISDPAVCGNDEMETGYFCYLNKKDAKDVQMIYEKENLSTTILPVVLQGKHLLFTDFCSITATRICLPKGDWDDVVFYFGALATALYELQFSSYLPIKKIELFSRPCLSNWELSISFTNTVTIQYLSNGFTIVSFMRRSLFLIQNPFVSKIENLFVMYKNFDERNIETNWIKDFANMTKAIAKTIEDKAINVVIKEENQLQKEIEKKLN